MGTCSKNFLDPHANEKIITKVHPSQLHINNTVNSNNIKISLTDFDINVI